MLRERQIQLLLVDDDPDLARIESEFLADKGFAVTTASSGEEARRLVQSQFFDLLILDERMKGMWGTQLLDECRRRFPGIAAIFVSGYRDVDSVVKALRAGALEFLFKPVDSSVLLAAIDRALEQSRRVREERYLRFAGGIQPEPVLVGRSAAWAEVLGAVDKVAATSASVLLLGESGTGKEMVARAIHARSPRADQPFVPVIPAAISPTLLESALFGHRKGAFTDAKEDRPGIFEAACDGTVFRDEIGEMSPEIQVKLLRVLQEKRLVRVGDVTEIPVDARVVAATNRDLEADVVAGKFRQDLYFRLSVFVIQLPPLRKRQEDIPLLAEHLLKKNRGPLGAREMGYAPESLAKLATYDWPGNVRELDNVIQRAIILAPGDTITPDLLVLGKGRPAAGAPPDWLALTFRDAQKRFEIDYFSNVLSRAGGNKSRASVLADIDRTVLYEHLRKIGLES